MAKKFAFLVHPRYWVDWKNGYWPANFLPSFILEAMGKKMKARKISSIGYRNIEGYLIGIPLMPRQMYAAPGFTRQRILEASQFAIEKLGVEVIGLGALLCHFTDHGRWLKGRLSDHITVTTGNTLTSAVSLEGLRIVASLRDWDLSEIKIAILGAYGNIASAVIKMLVEEETNLDLLLIGPKMRKLENLRKQLPEGNVTITLSTENHDAAKADLVGVFTGTPEEVVHPEHLKPGAAVFDITHPSNTSPKAIKACRENLFLETSMFQAL